MKRVFRDGLAIPFIFFAAGAFAQTVEKPEVHVGDRWTWQHTNGLVNEKDFSQIEDVVNVSDSEIRTRLRIKGRPGSLIATYNRDWNPIDLGSAKYEPYLKNFAFPLQAGKKWDATADKMLFSNGKHGKFFLKANVVAFEKVTVPAGVFDAYKVNVVLDASGTDEDANIGHTVETYWYAPAVQRYVKVEYVFSRDGRVRTDDIYDLLEFSLR